MCEGVLHKDGPFSEFSNAECVSDEVVEGRKCCVLGFRSRTSGLKLLDQGVQ